MRTSLLQVAALCFLATMVLGACKSKDDHADPSNLWNIDGVTYIVSFSQSTKVSPNPSGNQTSYSLSASDAGFLEAVRNSVLLKFGEKPVADGSIQIGNDSGQLRIYVSQGIGDGGKVVDYVNPPTSTDRASYSFTNGKITVDVPEISLSNMNGQIVRFSAHIIEQ